MTSSAPAGWAREGVRTLRYAVVGAGVQVLYLAVMALCVRWGWAYGWAMAAGHLVAIAVAFPLQRHLVFAPGGSVGADFVRFLTVWATGACFGVVGTIVLVEVAQWQPVLAQATVIAAGALLVYLGQRLFTFRPRGPRLTP